MSNIWRSWRREAKVSYRPVVAENDLTADVYACEARGRGVDIDEVLDLVLGERGNFAGLEAISAPAALCLDLAAGHLDKRPVFDPCGGFRLQADHLSSLCRRGTVGLRRY